MLNLITRTNPVYRSISNDLWRDFFNMESTSEKECEYGSHTPAVDISELDNTYQLKIDVPGMKREEIDISVNKGTLTISGERETEEEKEGNTYYRCERFHGNFKRSFHLGEGINEDEIEANLADGVLTINLPKQPDKAVRQIPLN